MGDTKNKSLSFKAICSLVGGKHHMGLGWGLPEVRGEEGFTKEDTFELGSCRMSRSLLRIKAGISGREHKC